MKYRRLPIEIEAPEQLGYDAIRCNLTESSFADQPARGLTRGLDLLLLNYGDHAGLLRLRKLIAADAGLGPETVVVTPGAAAALFIAATSILEKGDVVLVAKPNYATNLETPRVLGAKVEELPLSFEEGWRVDPDAIKKRLKKGKVKLVSLTAPHNPTGAMMTDEELRAVVKAVEAAGSRLLLDETYRDMAFGAPLPMAASLSPRAISVSSISKTYGVPGLRTGWLVTSDPALCQTFLAGKEQIVICGSTIDEELGARVLERRLTLLPVIKATIRKHLDLVDSWINDEHRLEWVRPKGGVACFPRIKGKVHLDRFYKTLNEKYKTHVGPGHWFDMDRKYFRIGYGWPKTAELKQGLAAISASLDVA